MVIKKENKHLELKENIDSNTFLKTVSAFANYNDGKIIFGIADDGTVKGVDDPKQACLNLENKINDNIKPIPTFEFDVKKDSTIELKVYKGVHKPYFYKGNAYKRSDTSTIPVDRFELNRLILEGSNQSYDEVISSVQDLSFNILNDELSKKLDISTINDDILRTLGLLVNKKYNNAAALVADKNQFYGVDIIRFGDNIDEIMDRKTIDNVSIFDLYHESLKMFEQYYVYEKIEGSLRIKKEKIPEVAFREALANAIIHRLWDINIRIRIMMYNDKIEISSPGGLPDEISKNEYLDGQISFLRNPIIANIFFRLNYIEALGTGIRRINNSYISSNSKPIYKIYDNSINVILPIITSKQELTDDEKVVASILKTNQPLSRLEIEKETNFNKSKIIRLVNSLIDKNYVIKNGETRNIKYLLNNNNE